MKEVLEFVSADWFANIATAISALGTIAAVIVSLWLSGKGEKIKYKIQRKVAVPLDFSGKFILTYEIELINLTRNNQIIIASFPYIKGKNENLFLRNFVPIYEVNEHSYEFPRKLNYGEKMIVCINKETVKQLLKYSTKTKFILVIEDVFGKKYKYKIKRQELELVAQNSQ